MNRQFSFIVALTLFAMVVGCSDRRSTQSPLAGSGWGVGKKRLFVASTDYVSPKGMFSSITDLSVNPLRFLSMPTHSDVSFRAPSGDWAYVINRFGADNVQKVSKDLTKVFPECKVGNLANPQDVFLIDENSVFVSVFKGSSLLKLSFNDCRVEPVLDLSPYADADGSPEMGLMLGLGDKLLLTLKRLDTTQVMMPPTDFSSLLVYDRRTGDAGAVRLARTNPVALKMGPDGALYVAEAGFIGKQSKADGGIERFDVGTLQSSGLIAEEAALNAGDLVDFEFIDANRLLILADNNQESQLLLYDVSRRQTTKTVWKGKSFTLPQVLFEASRNLVLLADRETRRPGIRVFDGTTLNERPDLFLETGMPPTHVELSD